MALLFSFRGIKNHFFFKGCCGGDVCADFYNLVFENTQKTN